MTPRERILAAFSPEGTPEIGAVTAYDDLFIRDHWAALTDVPWWYAFSGIADREIAWVRDTIARTGLDWLMVRACPPRTQRTFELREDGVSRVDSVTGQRVRLAPPTVSGIDSSSAVSVRSDPENLPTSQAQIDDLLAPPPPFDPATFLAAGHNDSVKALRGAFDLLLYGHIASPLWLLYDLFGYEGMMLMLAQTPELAAYTARRLRDGVVQRIHQLAALGVDAVWIEECLTDQIRPALFRALNVPLVADCVAEIRACGMKSIYYYCGDPNDRLDAILDAGADAIALEEGKKGFRIDIAEIVAQVQGRCVVFGNLDAISVLQDGSDDLLRAEISRQLRAAAANGHRFVMSTGSPITPGTPVARVRRYAELVRENRRG